MEGEKKNSGMVIWSVAITVVIAVGAYGFFKYTKRDVATTDTPVATPVSPTATPPAVTTSYTYKNGVYSAIGEYVSPGGAEEVGVELTIKDDVIVDAKVTPKAVRPNSVKYQGIFADNYKTFVVGKKLAEVSVDKVSGSSLTPKGFMDAVEQIRVQAKA